MVHQLFIIFNYNRSIFRFNSWGITWMDLHEQASKGKRRGKV
ncbi:MAG: hypothetical protein ACFE91_12525 [Promethearchaeota archaeon]